MVLCYELHRSNRGADSQSAAPALMPALGWAREGRGCWSYSWTAAGQTRRPSTLFRPERQPLMKRAHTKTNSAGKRLKIGDETRGLYEKRDRSLDHDPDAPVLSPEVWQNDAIGKYYSAAQDSGFAANR